MPMSKQTRFRLAMGVAIAGFVVGGTAPATLEAKRPPNGKQQQVDVNAGGSVAKKPPNG